MIWIVSSAMWYLTGLFCFYLMADFSSIDWQNGYYLWDKIKDLFFVGAITYNVPSIKSFKLVFYFCVIRVIWEIISQTTGLGINNEWVINALFLLFLIMWLYKAIKELKEWQRLKR